jgi:hypothetical protein
MYQVVVAVSIMNNSNAYRRYLILIISIMIIGAGVGVIGVVNAAGQSDLTISPADETISSGSTTTVDVIVEPVDGGVGSAQYRLNITNPRVASIEDARPGNSPVFDRTEIGPDGDTVSVEYAGDDTQDNGSVSILTITIEAEDTGTTDIEAFGLSANQTVSIGDEGGNAYDIATVNTASITVEEDNSSSPEPTPTPTPTPTPPQTETENTTVTVQLESTPNGLQRFNVSVAGPSGSSITTVSAGVLSGNLFEIVSGGEGDSTVTARGVDFTGAVGESSDPTTLYEATFEGTVNRSDLTVTVNDLTNDNGNAINEDTLTIDVQQPSTNANPNPFPSGIPGVGSAPPTDTDDDGKLEDIDGDGKSTFEDAIALAFADTGEFNSQQRAAVDFDGDGNVDFNDAIELAFE